MRGWNEKSHGKTAVIAYLNLIFSIKAVGLEETRIVVRQLEALW